MAYSIGVSVYCDLVMSFDCIKAAYEKYPFALAWKQCLRKEEFGRGGLNLILVVFITSGFAAGQGRRYHGPTTGPRFCHFNVFWRKIAILTENYTFGHANEGGPAPRKGGPAPGKGGSAGALRRLPPSRTT